MDTDTMFTLSRTSRFSTVAKATTKKGVGATPSSNSTVRSAPVKPLLVSSLGDRPREPPGGVDYNDSGVGRLAVWTHHRLQLQRRPLLLVMEGFVEVGTCRSRWLEEICDSELPAGRFPEQP